VYDQPENKISQEQATGTGATSQGELSSQHWLNEISAAEKNLAKWREQARKIVRRYLDRRDTAQESMNKLNLFTANVQILIATLYAKFPKPVVTREFEDEIDDVARVAGTMMERMLKIRPRDEFDDGMRHVVQDRLVPGMGTVWFRYEPTFEKRQTEAVLDPVTGQVLIQAQEYEEIVDEKVCCDYVFWEDFLMSPARTWAQNRWVGRMVKMTKEDAEKRFGAAIAQQLTYTKGKNRPEDKGTSEEGPDDSEVNYACVYEIWCKRSKTVYWVSKGFHLILDKKPDMLKLPDFWPCPRPMIALHSTSNFMPRPDYLIGQDQYEELDMINDRITKIERAIKVVGVYDGNNAEVERIFTEGIDNKIIPSRGFRDFMEKGGMKGAIDWLPIEAMVNALQKLREYRQDLIQQIYEVYGISDIMRGSTRASETLGAQQLKAQYGSVRLQFLQMEVATFVEEALQIKSEIIRNFFQPSTILRESNITNSNDAPFAQEAIQLIQSPEYKYRVEVQADSMAVPEFNAERDGRMAFVRALAEMMTAAAPLAERNPGIAVPLMKITQWAGASFRTGRTIETVIDQAIRQMEQAAAAPPPPPPPPSPKEQSEIVRNEGQAALSFAKAEQTKVDTALAPTQMALDAANPSEQSGPPSQ
jgi:hypothetical protein